MHQQNDNVSDENLSATKSSGDKALAQSQSVAKSCTSIPQQLK